VKASARDALRQSRLGCQGWCRAPRFRASSTPGPEASSVDEGGPKANHGAVHEDFEAQVELARWAVRRWAAFPVDASARPLVLAGLDVVTHRGFRTSEAKEAFGACEFEWSVVVPECVRARLCQGAVRRSLADAASPLVITHAGAGRHEFITDRGPRILPAWWIQGPATVGPIWVLDPEVEDWRPEESASDPSPPRPRLVQPLLWPIELQADGRSIVIPWLGSHAVVETFPRAELIESRTAVSAVAERKDMGFRGFVTAVGIRHDVLARLSAPLGNRVFVNLHGDAMQLNGAR
jgi:hypothetical protein